MARRTALFVVAAVALAGTVFAQSSAAPSNDLPHTYRTTRDWGELPAGVKWAAVTAVETAPGGTIYVVHRCFANSCAGRAEAPILKYDAAGRLLATWGQGLFVFPHGATVDPEGNLWVTDAGGQDGKGHQVFKFNPDGRVVMTLGRAGVSGAGPDLFDQPTDVVIAPAGDIFVTDSHRNGRNNRVVHFTREGKYIKEWGGKGAGRGQLSEPHTIAIDSRGRLFVGDRENNRIQIFGQDGAYLDEWRQFGRPSGIVITRDDTIYVTDSESGPDTGAGELMGIKKGIRIGSARDGRVIAFIEDSESTVAPHSGAEGVGVDALGNVYGAVVRRQMLERHVPAAMVYAVSYVEVLPPSSPVAAAAFKRYRDATRGEPGAVALDLFERPDRRGHFAVIETWRDQRSFDAHAEAPHTKALAAALMPLRVSGYDQRPYKPLAIAAARPAAGGRPVHVITHVDTVPGPQSDGPGLLTRLAEASRKEPGNLRFDVLQHAMRANHFTIVESWQSEEAVEAHAAAAHTKQYRDALQPFSGGPLDERIYGALE